MNSRTFYLIPIQQQKTTGKSVQKTFNRLMTKLESLKAKEIKMTQELDQALHLYFEKIQPNEHILQTAIADRIKILHQYYKTPKCFTKLELKVLKDMISYDFEAFCQLNQNFDTPSEIKEIFEEIHETTFEEQSEQEQKKMKNEAFEWFKCAGIDPDSLGIKADTPLDEIMQKMSHSFQEILDDLKHTNNNPSKNKKMSASEIKRKKLEEIMQKKLGDMYKHLARILHPDLEQDSTLQMAKQELMIKLNDAYRRKDLYDILNIEIETANSISSSPRAQTNEYEDARFETYNTILKRQIKTLERNLYAYQPLMHPKYGPIQPFFISPHISIITSLKNYFKLLQKDIQTSQDLLAQLNSPEGKEIIKETIKARRKVKKLGVVQL